MVVAIEIGNHRMHLQFLARIPHHRPVHREHVKYLSVIEGVSNSIYATKNENEYPPPMLMIAPKRAR
jgi:hypothetical protein